MVDTSCLIIVYVFLCHGIKEAQAATFEECPSDQSDLCLDIGFSWLLLRQMAGLPSKALPSRDSKECIPWIKSQENIQTAAASALGKAFKSWLLMAPGHGIKPVVFGIGDAPFWAGEKLSSRIEVHRTQLVLVRDYEWSSECHFGTPVKPWKLSMATGKTSNLISDLFWCIMCFESIKSREKASAFTRKRREDFPYG